MQRSIARRLRTRCAACWARRACLPGAAACLLVPGRPPPLPPYCPPRTSRHPICFVLQLRAAAALSPIHPLLPTVICHMPIFRSPFPALPWHHAFSCHRHARSPRPSPLPDVLPFFQAPVYCSSLSC